MKKIIFLLVLGGVIGYLVTTQNSLILSKVNQYSPVKFQVADKSVQGASTSATAKDLTLIQQGLAKLSVSDIATSSPKVQSLIHLLQKLPKEQIKMVCQNVCNGIQ